MFIGLEKTTPSFKQKIHFPFHQLRPKVFLFDQRGPFPPAAASLRTAGFAKSQPSHQRGCSIHGNLSVPLLPRRREVFWQAEPSLPGCFVLSGEMLEMGQRRDARALCSTLSVMQTGLHLRWSLSNVIVRVTNF